MAGVEKAEHEGGMATLSELEKIAEGGDEGFSGLDGMEDELGEKIPFPPIPPGFGSWPTRRIERGIARLGQATQQGDIKQFFNEIKSMPNNRENGKTSGSSPR